MDEVQVAIYQAAAAIVSADLEEAEYYLRVIDETCVDLVSADLEVSEAAEWGAFELAHDFQLSVSHYNNYVLVTSTLIPIQPVRYGRVEPLGEHGVFDLEATGQSIQLTKEQRRTSTAHAIMAAIVDMGRASLRQQGVH